MHTTPRETTVHTPVLLQQIIDDLAIRTTDVVVDGTAGGGGHATAILNLLGSSGRYIAIDTDRTALARVEARLGTDARVTYIHGNFRDIDSLLASVGVTNFDKLLLDLGLSSDQLEVSGRGFSFAREEPLLMTLHDTPSEESVTAWHVVNEWSETSIADILYGFGGERASRKIARAIVERRDVQPIQTTTELADLIATVVRKRGRVHPATQTFQAIRMAVNDELGALKDVFTKALPLLRPEGRIATITFHSLEDRVVKHIFREWQQSGFGHLVHKRPIAPTREECVANPRARSAKLRCFEKQDQD